MPYRRGTTLINDLFVQNQIDITTPNHQHNIDLEEYDIPVSLSIPGYKYKTRGNRLDYLVKFQYDGINYNISHCDIAMDIFQKTICNPELTTELRNFIYQIGIQGDDTPVPHSLLNVIITPPNANAIQFLRDNIPNNRLSALPFGIPIRHYPFILYWVSLNEEVNYHPTFSSRFGGRRTAFKRYIEAIYYGEIAFNRHNFNGQLHQLDLQNCWELINRTIAGRCVNLRGFPYVDLFNTMDQVYVH